MIRLVVADDHPVVLNGLEQILRAEKDFQVIACCTDGDQAIVSVRELDPDMLILDLRMPRMDGLAVLQELQRFECRTRIILLTASLDAAEIRQAIISGASGVILKDSAVHLLVACIRSVMAGERWLDPGNVRRLLAESDSTGHIAPMAAGRLTDREVELLFMVACRLTVDEVARALGLSESAVRAQIERLCRKLDVDSVADLDQFVVDSRPIPSQAPAASADKDPEAFQLRRMQKQFGLTPREAAVGLLLAQGFSNKEIADRLEITLNTVKTHVAAVHAKAEVSSTRKLLVVLRSI